MKRDTRAAYRARAAATERLVDESVAAVKAEARADWDAARPRIEARLRDKGQDPAAIPPPA